MCRPSRPLWLCALLLPILAGCPRPPQQTPLMKSAKQVTMSADELRIRVRALQPRSAGIITGAADRILSESADPVVRRNALLWKMNAVPVASQAAFLHDPLAALLDLWAFSIQQRDFLTTGDGNGLFGEYQPVAIEAAKKLEAEIEDRARVVGSGDIDRAMGLLAAWTAEHPIEGAAFRRESIASYVADLVAVKKAGAFASVGALTYDIADLALRVDLLADQMPQQARWQAEFLLGDYLPRSEVQQALGDLTRLADELHEPARVIADLPGTLDRTEGEIEVAVAREREAVLHEIERQIGRTLTFLTAERTAVLAQLQQEREAVIASLQDEREIVLASIHEERSATMEDAEEMAARLVGAAEIRARHAIDHFFLRLVQLLAAVALVAGVAVFLLLRRLRPAAAA